MQKNAKIKFIKSISNDSTNKISIKKIIGYFIALFLIVGFIYLFKRINLLDIGNIYLFYLFSSFTSSIFLMSILSILVFVIISGLIFLLLKLFKLNKKIILGVTIICFVSSLIYSIIFSMSIMNVSNYSKIEKPTDYESFKVQYVTLDTGSKIGYFHFDNPNSPFKPLIVNHGGPGGGVTKSNLDIAYYLYNKGLDVYIYDQAGVGWSENIKAEDYTLKRTVEDLESFRKKLNLDKINLYGKSFGGVISLAYAKDYKENLNKIILENSGSYVSLEKYEKQIENYTKRLGSSVGFKNGITPPRLESFFLFISFFNEKHQIMEKYFPQDEIKYLVSKNVDLDGVFKDGICENSSFTRKKDIYMENSNFNIYSNYLLNNDPNLDEQYLIEDLKEITAPVLFFKGECDYVGDFVYEDFQNLIPNFTGIILKDRGHMAFLIFDKENENLNKAVDFLKE